MSKNPILNAEPREGSGKGVARKIRAEGRLPAVVYGREADPVHVMLNTREAELLFHSISVENTIIDLKIDGEADAIPTLVREVQVHPFRPEMLHVDFYRIQKGVAVEVDVPVRFVGTPTGVRMDGGILDQIIHDLHIRCIPSKIPDSIEVDVTELELNQSLHVSDLTAEEGVEIMTDPARTLCTVSIPKVEEEEVEEVLEDEAAEPERVGEEPAEEGDTEAEGE